MGTKYRPELIDTRIYQPGVGLHPNQKQAAFVGKPVHVVWQQPVFNMVRRPAGDPFHVLARHDGYVIELDKMIPQEDLKHLTQTPKDK